MEGSFRMSSIGLHGNLPVSVSDLDAAMDEYRAAEFLSISARTLQAWRVRGGGPRFLRLGRAIRYRRRDLVAFQEANIVSSTSEVFGAQ
jgi:hypothetical protein